ncbi:MAG: hypothetical protein FWH20_02000 [Oscillospiraceae bacterium]|nr:hypothetical protein [Oscillospiraceae bacterium]
MRKIKKIKWYYFLVIILAVIIMMTLFTACEPISDMSMRTGETTGETELPDEPVTPETPEEPENPNPPEDDPQDVLPPRDFAALHGAPLANTPAVLNSPYGALYNLTDDIFIYGKEVDRRVYPSGAVKLLTALTVVEAVPPDTLFTVGDEIEMIGEDSGVAGLFPGQVLDLQAILSALLMTVGNDAAYTISVNTARYLTQTNGENREMNDYFLRLMNARAEKADCIGSQFTNPCGFHADSNYSTVRDLAIISAMAAKNPLITEIAGAPRRTVTFETGEVVEWTNINALLNIDDYDIRGLRTGYTNESGFSAQILAQVGGKEYIIVVSGSDSADQRERDVTRLLEMAKSGYDANVIDTFYD